MNLVERVKDAFSIKLRLKANQIPNTSTLNRFKDLELDLEKASKRLEKEKYEGEDIAEFNNMLDNMVNDIELFHKGKPEKIAKEARFIYANSFLFLTNEAQRRKGAISEKLKQLAEENIQKAQDKTEEVEKIALNRRWVSRNIILLSTLVDRNDKGLIKNLTIFINNPPVLKKA